MAPLVVLQEIHDLRLRRHVEGRSRLVEHDQMRLKDDRAGDGDALALAAGEFVRVAVLHGGVDTHFAQRLRHDSPLLRVGQFRLMHTQSRANDLADRKPRREAAVGVLEDDLHLFSQRSQRLGFQRMDLLSVEFDLAPALDQPQHRERERRLAGAGLADDAEGVAGANRHGDVVHGLQHASAREQPFRQVEMHADVLGAHDNRGVRVRGDRLTFRFRRQQMLRIGVPRRVEYLRR